jgi:hypothetical protein
MSTTSISILVELPSFWKLMAVSKQQNQERQFKYQPKHIDHDALKHMTEIPGGRTKPRKFATSSWSSTNMKSARTFK